MPTRTLPLIGIPSCVRSIHERAFHTVNERYTSAVIDAVGGLPVLIPAIGPMADCGAILDRLDGILLTGSPSNVEPHHYGGPPSREGTLHDPDRDATTLPLIREAGAPDGQSEAVSLPGARFVVGVQWHPEYKPLQNPFSRSLFDAFAQACHATSARTAAKRHAA